MKQLPADVKEAVDLLRAFERTEDYYAKPELFIEAIEILDLHLKDNPDSSYKDYINNIKKSYAKVFTRQLDRVPEDAFLEEILNYTQALDDIEKILDETEDREAYVKYLEFVDMWKDELKNSMKFRMKKSSGRNTEFDLNSIFNE